MWYFQRLILLISFSWWVVSCAPPRKLRPARIEIQDFNVPYFLNPQQDYIYQMELEIYGKQFSGIIAVKQIEPVTYRIAITTELGNKLLDFEISEKGYQLHFAIKPLRKKRILKLLDEQFRWLLVFKYDLYRVKDDTNIFYTRKLEDKKRILFIMNENDNLLDQMKVYKKGEEYIQYDFINKNSTFVEKMEILQTNAKYKLKLKRIQ